MCAAAGAQLSVLLLAALLWGGGLATGHLVPDAPCCGCQPPPTDGSILPGHSQPPCCAVLTNSSWLPTISTAEVPLLSSAMCHPLPAVCSVLCCLPSLPCRRPYTPTTSIAQRGFVDFVIKLYPDGQMSQILAQVRPASC